MEPRKASGRSKGQNKVAKGRASCAAAVLLQPPLLLVGVSIVMERGCQQGRTSCAAAASSRLAVGETVI